MAEYKKLIYFYDRDLAFFLGWNIDTVFPEFDFDAFVRQITATIDHLELKARGGIFADCMRECFPSDYKTAVSILLVNSFVKCASF